jgi:fructose-specific phosphotransferase system IIC component
VLLVPLSFIAVLLDSLWIIVRAKPQKEIENLDLIFFYPSVAAYVLGILWLLAPVGLVTYGMRHFLTETHTSLQNLIAAVAAVAILAMIGICWRRVHQIRQKTYEVIPDDEVPAEPEE